MPRPEYEVIKRQLQIELLKLQNWVKDTGQRLVILFEGRDAAGKGGRSSDSSSTSTPGAPRWSPWRSRASASEASGISSGTSPTCPTAGEIVLFDRSWYNRAGVERVMGFCSDAEYHTFIEQAPEFERLLTGDGMALIKLWFSVSRAEQRTRFLIRRIDPVRQWKLSPTDLASLDRWDDYTAAKEAMFEQTDTDFAPVDGGEEQRQEAGPDQRHALRARAVRLSPPGRRRRRRARPPGCRPGLRGIRARRGAGRSSGLRPGPIDHSVSVERATARTPAVGVDRRSRVEDR